MPNVAGAASGALTRKLGPLPVWGWGVAIGGSLLAVRMLRGGDSRSGQDAQVITVPTGAPLPSAEYLSDVGSALQDVRERLDWLYQQVNNNQDESPQPATPTTPPTTTPTVGATTPKTASGVSGDALANLLRGLRSAFPTVWARYSGPRQQPGETSAQRQARLQAEYAWWRAQTGASTDLGTILMRIRDRFASVFTRYTGPKQVPGETAQQRAERLQRELAWWASQGVI